MYFMPFFASAMEQQAVSATTPIALYQFRALPHDVQRIIKMMALHALPHEDLEKSLQNLKNFMMVNKSFYAFVNSPKNMKALLNAMAHLIERQNVISLAMILQNMPGVKHAQTQEWLALRKAAIPLEEKLVYCDTIDELDQLLAAGVNINAQRTLDGATALMHSLNVMRGIQYIQQLLIRGANADICDKYGHHALLLAAHNVVYIKEILKYSRWVNRSNNSGCTPIEAAVVNWESLEELLKAGANINAQNSDGETVLMRASGNTRLKSVTVLLRYGADINVQDKKGETALMKTIDRGNHPQSCLPTLQALLNAGANVLIRNKKGNTALDEARNYALCAPEIIVLLEKKEQEQRSAKK